MKNLEILQPTIMSQFLRPKPSFDFPKSKHFIYLMFILLISSQDIFANCNLIYRIEISGFYCGGEGTICVKGNNSDIGCDDYEFQLEYPTGSFAYSSLGPYWSVKSINPLGNTILKANVDFYSDGELS